MPCSGGCHPTKTTWQRKGEKSEKATRARYDRAQKNEARRSAGEITTRTRQDKNGNKLTSYLANVGYGLTPSPGRQRLFSSGLTTPSDGLTLARAAWIQRTVTAQTGESSTSLPAPDLTASATYLLEKVRSARAWDAGPRGDGHVLPYRPGRPL